MKIMTTDDAPTYPEPLCNFKEGQWWIKELDNMAQKDGMTADQKRAVAVVHHLLKAIAHD